MKHGITRSVILIGKYAFKFPSVRNYHTHFIQGCLANWKERKYYKEFSRANYNENMVGHVAPSYFCSWFGLLQIQARCKPYYLALTDDQKKFFFPLCGLDAKSDNFGYYKGKMVCLDYGI